MESAGANFAFSYFILPSAFCCLQLVGDGVDEAVMKGQSFCCTGLQKAGPQYKLLSYCAVTGRPCCSGTPHIKCSFMVSPASAWGTRGLCLGWGESQGSVGNMLLMWRKLLPWLSHITFIQHQVPPSWHRYVIAGCMLMSCFFTAVIVMHLSKSLVRSYFSSFHK